VVIILKNTVKFVTLPFFFMVELQNFSNTPRTIKPRRQATKLPFKKLNTTVCWVPVEIFFNAVLAWRDLLKIWWQSQQRWTLVLKTVAWFTYAKYVGRAKVTVKDALNGQLHDPVAFAPDRTVLW